MTVPFIQTSYEEISSGTRNVLPQVLADYRCNVTRTEVTWICFDIAERLRRIVLTFTSVVLLYFELILRLSGPAHCRRATNTTVIIIIINVIITFF
jgi:hypothetical protein